MMRYGAMVLSLIIGHMAVVYGEAEMPTDTTIPPLAVETHQTLDALKYNLYQPPDILPPTIVLDRTQAPSATIPPESPPMESSTPAFYLSYHAAEQKQDTLSDLLHDAYKAHYVGQIEAAFVLYTRILEKEPDNLLALYAIAGLYHQQLYYEEAMRLYARILEKNPTHEKALNNYLLLVARESPEKALHEFRKLEAAQPEQSIISAQIGSIYASQGDYTRAAKAFKRASLHAPDNLNYQFNLAVCLDRLGAVSEAIHYYQYLLAAARAGHSLPLSSSVIYDRVLFLTKQ